MIFYASDFRNYEAGTEKEWLLTNGMGGFASSTVIGANTRRYHSLLTISKNPPADRTMILSKLDEIVVFRTHEMSLASQRVNGHVTCGYSHLLSAEIGRNIVYTFLAGQAIIVKTITMVREQDRILVRYAVSNKGPAFELRIMPLMNSRYFHFINRKENINPGELHSDTSSFTMKINDTDKITLEYPGCSFHAYTDTYYHAMEYDCERQRGLDFTEDHYIPGYITKEIEKGMDCEFTLDIHVGDKKPLPELSEEEIHLDHDKILEQAALDFIVHRKSTGAASIIAGYPWFNDWGRDAMIALPGILLETGRYGDARDVLRTFSKYEKAGIIPNMLPDGPGEPLYNSVDASLWFVVALYRYFLKTGDMEFISTEMLPVAKRIIENYRGGTMFGIRMDHDYLIAAGNEHIQLTWMDAKVGDFVVTPRHGKAVEINALWHSALMILSELTGEAEYAELAAKVCESFNRSFTDPSGTMLYDYIDSGFEKKRSEDVRPNAIFSISLPFPVLDRTRWKPVFDRIFTELYTPYGLRSLTPMSKDYRGYYGGDQFERDTAYHQGTVWAWLAGPFADACLKVYGDRELAMKLIRPLLGHITGDGCINSVSEIFEGSYPHRARGAPAQAWSVGELLRAYRHICG